MSPGKERGAAAVPRRPRLGALAPLLPWTDGTGRPWRGWRRLPLAAPFVLIYLAFHLTALAAGFLVTRRAPAR